MLSLSSAPAARHRVAGLAHSLKTRAGARLKKGITLVELIAVAVILGVFALIVVPNVVNALGISKGAAFQTSLSELQSSSDQFYAINNVYPTYAGAYSQATANQPVAGTAASQINTTAQDVNGDGQAFAPNYIRTAPSTSAAAAGLNLSNGSTVYYGVVASGQIFASQTAPVSNQWTTGTSDVYTVQNPSGSGVALSTIWGN
jgi:prepilin-type N-terminal cleavage/methylation domain-containing protein